MSGEAERVDAYLGTLARMKPVAMVDQEASLASIAISLKRIADALDRREWQQQTCGSQSEYRPLPQALG